MKPIYFPFTYIPEAVANSLSWFLGRIVLLQPVQNNQPDLLRRLEEGSYIEIHVPYTEEEDRLIACSKEFQHWGRLHQGEESSLKDIFKSGFSNQTFTSQIRTDILQKNDDEPADPDSVFLSRLFLLMAQELDMQQSEVDREVALSIDDEMELFTSMTGEEKILDPPKESYFKNDFGEYMTGSRISAWFNLIKNDAEDSVFFVTNSQAVLDVILEKITGLEKVCCLDGISCDQPESVKKEFNQCLENLSRTPWDGPNQSLLPDFNFGSGKTVNFKLYILPEVNPDEICNFFSKDKILPKGNKNSRLNTLIGFFEL